MRYVDELRDALKIYNLRQVARDSGLTYERLWRFKTGRWEPSYSFILQLDRYLPR